MPRLFLIAALLLSGCMCAHAQLSKEEHDAKLSKLTDEQKVDYIIKNNYALYSADFDHALALTKQAAELSRKNSWADKEAHCYMVLGVIYFLKGNFENALPSYLKSYSIFDSLKNYNGLARLCNEIAVFHSKQKEIKSAYEYLDKAEQFARKVNDSEQLGTTYGHRATLLEREGKIKEAYALYEKVYTIRLENKDSIGLGYALLDLSTMALRSNDLKNALAFIEQSTVIRRKIGDQQGVAVNLVNTGEAYFSVKEYRKAISYFEQCLQFAIKIGFTDLIRYTYGQLAQAHVELGDFKNAFFYQQKSQAFNDSLFSIEKTKVIAELQTKYETEKKEQQIALQNAELSEKQAWIQQTYFVIGGLILSVIFITIIFLLTRSRHRREQELLIKDHEIAVREAYIFASVQSQEDERRRFARDLHDGMGQLISALRLSLLSMNKDSTLQQRLSVVNKAEGLLNDMHHEIRSIAFNLMPQTLVQSGIVPALSEMSERINQSEKIIIRVNSFDMPERLSEVQEISLYRAIQEWVNNVSKYSDANLIEIQLIGHDQEIAVTIEDNGAGFDPHQLGRSKGNGWKNIKSRINLIKGVVDIDTQPGRKGTTLIFRVPIIINKTTEQVAVTLEQ